MKTIASEIVLIVSYNKDLKERHQRRVGTSLIIPLSCTFNSTGRDEDKSPDNVQQDDENWQFVLLCKNAKLVRRVIVFLGLVSSGSAAMIDLIAEDFADMKERCTFVLCPHDLEWKKRRLFLHGFTPDQIVDFWDDAVLTPGVRCKEWDTLWHVAETCAK